MKKNYIDIINVISLRGPNIWTYRPVLEAWVDIGDLEDSPSNTIPGFYERLSAWLPGLVEHRCSIGERGGFLQRLREGTWPGHILEHVMIELQTMAGMPIGFGRARETGQRGVYKVVVSSHHEQISRHALHAARDLVMAAIEGKPFDVAPVVESLRKMTDIYCLGPSTACIVDAAVERGIPTTRLNDGNLVQLGYGMRQHRIWTAETDSTRAIAESIACDKDLAKSLLRACGVPVPEGYPAASPEQAWELALEIGLPVVVKPSDGNRGRGVSTNLTTREAVEAAWGVASMKGSSVLVEHFVTGDEHRLLVVGGKLVAAARGQAAVITGDGISTVAQLIDNQLNTDPLRGDTEDFPLDIVRLEEAPAAVLELRRQGYEAASVPPKGKQLTVLRHGNVAFDVTDQVHPRVAELATLAARVVGLDVAGIDMVAEDISRPLEEQNGALVEINAGPGLVMHLKPSNAPPRPVGRAIVDNLFAAHESGRIPLVGICGSHGRTLAARLVARMLHLQGTRTGLACGDGLYLNERRIAGGDCAHWKGARRVLVNRAVQAAVLENGARTILAEGLAYDRCQVGVVTNIDPADRVPDFYVEQPEQIVNVIRTQVDLVLPDGVAVLNAADARVAELAPLCDGEVMFFAATPDAPPLGGHLERQGRAVLVRDGRVVLATGAEEAPLFGLATLPAAVGTTALESVLAAIGAAWALGLPAELIRAGIETCGNIGTPAAVAA